MEERKEQSESLKLMREASRNMKAAQPRQDAHIKYEKPRRNFRRTPEKLVMQLIICGFILITVLAFNFIQLDFTNGIKSSLKNAITKNTTVEETQESFSKTMGNITALGGKVKTFLVKDESADENTEETDISETMPDKPELTSYLSEKNRNARIDEDILEEIEIKLDTD